MEVEHDRLQRVPPLILTNGPHLTCKLFRELCNIPFCCTGCHKNGMFYILAMHEEHIRARLKSVNVPVPLSDGVAVVCCSIWPFYYSFIREKLGRVDPIRLYLGLCTHNVLTSPAEGMHTYKGVTIL